MNRLVAGQGVSSSRVAAGAVDKVGAAATATAGAAALAVVAAGCRRCGCYCADGMGRRGRVTPQPKGGVLELGRPCLQGMDKCWLYR